MCKMNWERERVRLRLVRVKVFSENRYFPEMLFSEKENIFMCLVAFQKMFRKIFSDVWLCSWKYIRKHILYLLLTFSHIFSVTKRIHNIIHSLKHKQNPEKNHQIRTNEGEIAISIADRRRRNRDRAKLLSWSRPRLPIGAVSGSFSLSLAVFVRLLCFGWVCFSLLRVLQKSFEGKTSM